VESLLLGAIAAWLSADALGWWQPRSRTQKRTGPSPAAVPARSRSICDAWSRPLASWLDQRMPRWIATVEREQSVLLQTEITAAERVAAWMVRSFVVVAACVWWSIARGFSSPQDLFFWTVLGFGGAMVAQWQWFLSETRAARADLLSDLPTAVELLSRIIEAGSGDLLAAWRSVAAEYDGHLLGAHFRYLLGEVSRGRTFRDALQSWADRTREEEVSEVVLLIRTAQERGTPLQESLRHLAEQARLRRIQRLEKAAGAARVHITWPGFLMLVACLLVACAPMVLTSVDTFSRIDLPSLMSNLLRR
jgi:Flp pilus assembly protein TadB